MAAHQSYNWLLVILSYVISVLGSYTALQLAVSIPLAQGRQQQTRNRAGGPGEQNRALCHRVCSKQSRNR